jgi:thermopsin
MGVADDGVDQSGNGYNYTTSEWVGTFDPVGFGTYNGTLGSDEYSASIQLNAMVVFEVSGVTYVYWTQDVATINSETMMVAFSNNVWNASAPNSSMYSSSIEGSGQVYTSSTGVGFYEYGYGISVPLSTNYPIVFRMQVGAMNGEPSVAFGFTVSNQSAVIYDTVAFPFAHTPIEYGPLYLVDGRTYTPSGLFFDAELIMGGPGNGASTTADDTLDTEMSIQYFNGHNLETPANEFNYGSDTAETISGVVDQAVPNGDVDVATQTYGAGTLGQLFDMSGVALLDISGAELIGGTVFLNSSSFSGTVVGVFHGNEWTDTVLPYYYSLTVVSGGFGYPLPPIDCRAGYTHVSVEGDVATSHTVAFVANGLPAGAFWSVTLGVHSGTTTGPYIEFAGTSAGPYSYTVVPPANYTAIPSSGNVTVDRDDVLVPIAMAVPAVASGSCPVIGPLDLGFLGLPCSTAYTLLLIVVVVIIAVGALVAARTHRSRVTRKSREAALSTPPTASFLRPPPPSASPPIPGAATPPPPTPTSPPLGSGWSPPRPPPQAHSLPGHAALPPPLPPPPSPPPPSPAEMAPAPPPPPTSTPVPPVAAGAAVPAPPPAPTSHLPWSYCPSCGKVVEDSSDRFCRACGRRRY